MITSVWEPKPHKIIKAQYEKYYDPKEYLRYTLQLVYDKKNYTIGPHTDSFKRAATQITYIVCDDDINKKLGVCVYKDLINRHKENWDKKHYSFDTDTIEIKKYLSKYSENRIKGRDCVEIKYRS